MFPDLDMMTNNRKSETLVLIEVIQVDEPERIIGLVAFISLCIDKPFAHTVELFDTVLNINKKINSTWITLDFHYSPRIIVSKKVKNL